MRFNINGKDIKIHNARIKSITTGLEQRLVNRVKLEFDSTKELNQYEKTKIKAAIESAINQNAEPVVHGHWENLDDNGRELAIPYCSQCLHSPLRNNGYAIELTDYCPHCGAKMDEVQE